MEFFYSALSRIKAQGVNIQHDDNNNKRIIHIIQNHATNYAIYRAFHYTRRHQFISSSIPAVTLLPFHISQSNKPTKLSQPDLSEFGSAYWKDEFLALIWKHRSTEHIWCRTEEHSKKSEHNTQRLGSHVLFVWKFLPQTFDCHRPTEVSRGLSRAVIVLWDMSMTTL